MIRRRHFQLLLAASLAVGACGKTKSKGDNRSGDEGNGGEDDGLSLTIPPDRWAASKYCGDVRPETPEDPTPEYRFAKSLINEKLRGDGLVGWVHGAVPSYQQYLFTYRNEDPDDPMAFFNAQQFSLVPADAEVAKILATLKRHDKLRLRGEIFENGSPLVHLKVTGIKILKKYDKPTENNYTFDLSRLQGKTNFEVFGLVHATIDSKEYGRAFVVEAQDLLMPLAVPPALDSLAAPLYRGDIVNVAVKVVNHEHGPPHFELDADAAKPLQVVDPMLNCHNRETTVTGYLAKFEKSPAISRDVYAVRVVDANGIGRNFTLFPDTDDQDEFVRIFDGISAKAKAAWDHSAAKPEVVRNFTKKEAVKVKVKGRLNVVSLEQANAQVYIKSIDDLTFE
jgi:hypothetical protein